MTEEIWFDSRQGKETSSSPKCQDRHWDNLNLLFNAFPLHFPRWWSFRRAKLNTRLSVMSRLRMSSFVHWLLSQASWRVQI